MKIVADNKIPFLKGVFEPVAEVVYISGASIKKEDIIDADAIIVRTRTLCNAQLLEGTSVKMVATATIGTDHFDIPWLEKSSIKWVNALGCNSSSVCQYIGSVLSLLIKEGLNPPNTTIGIVGAGMVGSKVAKLAEAFGMRVLLNDPPRQRNEKNTSFCDLKILLNESDIVTFHTPLSKTGIDATYHLFNDSALQLLKEGAIIINSSRGEVTGTNTLLKGIESKKISKVILDVWENEPDINRELLKKVWIGTPHIAGYSADGKANGTTMSVQAISRFFNLGLDNWQPDLISVPKNSVIEINHSDKKTYEIIAETILHTYNVKNDDARLRNNSGLFEKQREDYPLRREFGIWEVAFSGNTERDETQDILKEMGLKIVGR